MGMPKAKQLISWKLLSFQYKYIRYIVIQLIVQLLLVAYYAIFIFIFNHLQLHIFVTSHYDSI